MFDFLLSKEQIKLRDEVRDLVGWVPRQMILDMDQDKLQFPKKFLAEAGRRNLTGCRYPVQWGGRAMDWVSTCMVMEEVGVLGYIFACVFGVGAELVCDAIVLHGTNEQKERYVKPLLAGKIFAAECLTEPRGGSDFFGTATLAVADGDDYLLTGQKRFIVDKGPGVTVEYLYGLMGCRGGGAGRVVFREARVPRANIVGRLNGALDVFNTMMIPERLGTAAMTIGAARPALEVAAGYTMRRKAFGQPINQFQGVSFQVAQAATLLDASRAMVYATARAVDAGVPMNRVRRLVSQTKKFVTESCQQVARHAMQVMGGIGYTNVFPVERIVRDLQLASIWTGTNEVMSMITAHEWYDEYARLKAAGTRRDHEMDAQCATDEEEKVYE